MLFLSLRTYSTATFRFLPSCYSFTGFAPEFNFHYQKNHAFSFSPEGPRRHIRFSISPFSRIEKGSLPD